MNERYLLQRVCDEYRRILGEKMVGFYVHGSIAFGCFTWGTGDIDFLVVVDAPLAQREKEALSGCCSPSRRTRRPRALR